MHKIQSELRKMFLEMMDLIFGEYQISSFPEDGDSNVQIWHTKCGAYMWDSWKEVTMVDVIKVCYEHNDKCHSK